MKPNYVANKSAWECVSFLWIISCILIFPLIILIFRIIAVKKFAMEFYNDKIIIKKGWLNTSEDQMTFMGVTAVSIDKSFWGSICNYGTVKVDCVGQKWDIDTTTYIKNPEGLKHYLQSRMVTAPKSAQFVQM